MTRPSKLECLYLAITFQTSLTFGGNTRSLPKKEASERFVQLGLLWPCPQIQRPDWKGCSRANPLAYWTSLSVTKEKKFYNIDTRWPTDLQLAATLAGPLTSPSLQGTKAANLFSLSFTLRRSKLVCFFIDKYHQSSLNFQGLTRFKELN